jgi:OOP family OmpA-OmpF porin
MQKTQIAVAAVVAALTAPAMADQSRWYINPMIGVQDYDTERGLDDETTYIIGGEYRYNDNWAAELRYLESSPDGKVAADDTDVSQYYIDALYYLQPADARWQPYALLGLGHADYDGKLSDSTETQANAGFGVRYSLSDSWSLRGDLRGLYGFDDGTWDSLASIGISYAFGGKKAAPAPVAGPVDSDGDGVVDAQDQCPNTPAGVAVDAKGCALDGDGDGVADYQDRCLNTPAGFAVDAEGCMKKRVESVDFDLSFRFAHDSAVVENYDQAQVDQLVAYLGKYTGAKVVIEGHTDSRGSDAYNKRLSDRRAAAVAAMLNKTYGISAERLSSVGYGEEQPIASNDTADGRAANRRVVAKVSHKREEAVRQ